MMTKILLPEINLPYIRPNKNPSSILPNMKHYRHAILCILASAYMPLLAQVSGNVNYPSNVNYQNQAKLPESNISINFISEDDLLVSVKGLANVKADSYVAIFAVTQTGKTPEEVNTLFNERVGPALEKFRNRISVETYVDMVSFVPMYEYDVEKKVFSKKSFNEVPAGFELKKNIHMKFADPRMLDEIITAFASAEIYDLVRVDYFSSSLEAVKKELMTKSKAVLQEKLKNYESILSTKLDSAEKQLADGFKVMLPVEMYKSYQAYNNSSLILRKPANIQQADKSTTLYYQPVLDKEFDFVINPVVLEPVIQVMYEIKMRVEMPERKEKEQPAKYMLLTPSGELKPLNLK